MTVAGLGIALNTCPRLLSVSVVTVVLLLDLTRPVWWFEVSVVIIGVFVAGDRLNYLSGLLKLGLTLVKCVRFLG